MFLQFRTYFAALIILVSGAANADLAIIAHPDYEGGELNEEIVRKLFLREDTSFPSGHSATPINHAVGSPDRENFFKYVLEMGEQRHKRYWSRKKSTGKKGSPKELASYDDVLNWVAATPLSIAYIDKKKVNESVKVLLTVYVFEGI